MLNVLVDKAIQRSTSKLQGHQPIFTISYSTIKPNQQTNKQSRSKTVNINKIPKIVKGSETVFQKWKSKINEKLKLSSAQTANLFSPVKNSKLNRTSSKNSDKINKTVNENTSPNNSKELEPPFQHVPHIDELKHMTLSPFLIHKKKLETKNHSMYQKRQEKQREPIKSLYLQYRQGLKNKTNKKVAFNKFYCQRRVSEGDAGNLSNKAMINSSGHFSRDNQDNEQNDLQNKVSKNVSFINTIQYKTIPRQQIRHYKIDLSQKEKSRKTSLGHTQNIFVRTKKHSNPQHLPELMNMTICAFNTKRSQANETQFLQTLPEQPLKDLETRGKTSNISIRKVYTQKRARKNFKDFEMRELRQGMQQKKGGNYRPWSPIKTNPLFNNDDDFLFEQSKTFNIYLESAES